MKVLHVITGLGTGGAENMLYKLLSGMDNERFESVVISLTDRGTMANKIEMLGVEVRTCNMRKTNLGLIGFLRLIKHIFNIKPEIVQTWMYHADLLGGVAARLLGIKNIVWNIRHSNLDQDKTRKTTIWAVKVCALFSGFVPQVIICNSKNAIHIHQQIGYKKHKFINIANGFDTDLLSPNSTTKERLQHELNIDKSVLLVGMVARFDAQKNHQGFIQAAALASKQIPNAAFIMVGTHIDKSNNRLLAWIDECNMTDKIYLLGIRDDIAFLMSAFDVLVVSSSYGEAFPNVIGEAMSCATPCVVTDVGDSAFIVGEYGVVAPAGDNAALAQGIASLLTMPSDQRQIVGQQARQRIEHNFALSSIVNQYENLYIKLSGRLE